MFKIIKRFFIPKVFVGENLVFYFLRNKIEIRTFNGYSFYDFEFINKNLKLSIKKKNVDRMNCFDINVMKDIFGNVLNDISFSYITKKTATKGDSFVIFDAKDILALSFEEKYYIKRIVDVF